MIRFADIAPDARSTKAPAATPDHKPAALMAAASEKTKPAKAPRKPKKST